MQIFIGMIIGALLMVAIACAATIGEEGKK